MEVLGKRAVPTKSEPRCKLCQHPRLQDINALLLRRSFRQTDEDGRQINEGYVLERLAEWGVQNPNPDNLKIHWGKHTEIVSSELADELDAETEASLQALIDAAPEHLSATNVAEWQIKLWMARELARIRSGEGPSVTTDQAQTAQKILVQARSDEAQRQILGGLAGAIGGAMKALGGAKKAETLELEAAEEAVVDA